MWPNWIRPVFTRTPHFYSFMALSIHNVTLYSIAHTSHITLTQYTNSLREERKSERWRFMYILFTHHVCCLWSQMVHCMCAVELCCIRKNGHFHRQIINNNNNNKKRTRIVFIPWSTSKCVGSVCVFGAKLSIWLIKSVECCVAVTEKDKNSCALNWIYEVTAVWPAIECWWPATSDTSIWECLIEKNVVVATINFALRQPKLINCWDGSNCTGWLVAALSHSQYRMTIQRRQRAWPDQQPSTVERHIYYIEMPGGRANITKLHIFW